MCREFRNLPFLPCVGKGVRPVSVMAGDPNPTAGRNGLPVSSLFISASDFDFWQALPANLRVIAAGDRSPVLFVAQNCSPTCVFTSVIVMYTVLSHAWGSIAL